MKKTTMKKNTLPKTFFILLFMLLTVCVKATDLETISSDLSFQTVTTSDYCDFLNKNATTDNLIFYDQKMGSDAAAAGIICRGSPGNYHYFVIEGREEEPVFYINDFIENYYEKNTSFVSDTLNDVSLKSNRIDLELPLPLASPLSLAPQKKTSSIFSNEYLQGAFLVPCFIALMMCGGEGEGPELLSLAENEEAVTSTTETSLPQAPRIEITAANNEQSLEKAASPKSPSEAIKEQAMQAYQRTKDAKKDFQAAMQLMKQSKLPAEDFANEINKTLWRSSFYDDSVKAASFSTSEDAATSWRKTDTLDKIAAELWNKANTEESEMNALSSSITDTESSIKEIKKSVNAQERSIRVDARQKFLTESQSLTENYRKLAELANKNKTSWEKVLAADKKTMEAKAAWAKGVLKLAEEGTDKFDLGVANEDDANLLGRLWLQEKYQSEPNSRNGALITFDGLKRYRPPFDKKSGCRQANLERTSSTRSAFTDNGHLRVLP